MCDRVQTSVFLIAVFDVRIVKLRYNHEKGAKMNGGVYMFPLIDQKHVCLGHLESLGELQQLGWM